MGRASVLASVTGERVWITSWTGEFAGNRAVARAVAGLAERLTGVPGMYVILQSDLSADLWMPGEAWRWDVVDPGTRTAVAAAVEMVREAWRE